MPKILAAIAVLVVLAFISLFVGVSDVSPWAILSGNANSQALDVFVISRVPRTLALVLAGAGMACCGLLMQMLARNKFVEPSTAGTTESASLGILFVLLVMPDLPVFARMLVAGAFALAGTSLFLFILRQIPLRSPLIVPLVGLMLGGVISAITTFFAYRFDMMQSIAAWTMGDFSSVLRGRYELLWIGFALTGLAYFAADRFTVAGMGEAFATNLGLNYRRVTAFGLFIVSMVTACVVVTCGVVPFLGLIVPNLVSLLFGDNMRRSLPWVAIFGAALVLACDIAGRLVIHPYEIPIGTMMGVVGAAIFLFMLLRSTPRAA
ncbi:ABC transporter permease [Limoniibacter endophyticus]|uniref:Iron ABC transporter permease n=1 Tax=Limoniibacter endophyticus TaxID=1565040 RepID=A0A8J3DEQ1_9HYPH|nr:ABC transporter permease [Limoniibacter endophyticus]GHC64066.1 iron ABC transporter permease [Limoniibacter endophyticus]